MPLLQRKRVILAKVETTYGVDSTPTGPANAMLVRNLNVTPQEADFTDRDLVRPYIGRSEQLPAAIRAMVDFEVEIAGAGTAGTVPGYGPLLRACAFTEQALAAPVTGTAVAGSTSTTLNLAVSASAVDGFYAGMPVRITGGTGNGQSGFIVSYVGATKVATVLTPWTVTPDATSTYSIDANVAYRPTSGPAFDSLSIYFNVDGVLHRLTGARGTVSISFKVKDIPTLKFQFTGLYNAVTDTGAPVPVYTAFQTPLTVTNVNTTPFSLHAAAAIMSDLQIDVSNQVVHRTLVGGSEAVLITDREPQGSATIEATTVAFKDWWTIARSAALGALDLTHGTVAGNRVRIASSRVQLTKPQYSDQDGVTMLQLGMNLIPSTAGNDELYISVL